MSTDFRVGVTLWKVEDVGTDAEQQPEVVKEELLASYYRQEDALHLWNAVVLLWREIQGPKSLGVE